MLDEKEEVMVKGLSELTWHHFNHSNAYRHFLETHQAKLPPYSYLSDVPYLPVGVFKQMELRSIPQEEIFKTLLSSGTTGSTPSRIFLDRQTAQRQTETLAHNLSEYIGTERLPLLIIDEEGAFKDPKQFSARGAALLGILNFGRDPFYLLDQGVLREAALKKWLEKHQGAPLLIFGFTFMVWKELIEGLSNTAIDLSQATLLHTGGWKKLQERSVTNDHFKDRLKEQFRLNRCHNFYGMVEQVGTVFMECEQGLLHTPENGDILIRNPRNWREQSLGEEGVIEILSLLPTSYPGHALLTEDLGKLIHANNCPCGRKGKAFLMVGRVPMVELRGCSDV